MRRLMVVLLVLAGSLAAADFSGVWTGKGGLEDPKYGLVPNNVQMTLVQAGSSLSGTLKIGNGKILKITAGSVAGNTLTFALANGTATLNVVGNQLQGRLTSSRGQIMDLAVTKK